MAAEAAKPTRKEIAPQIILYTTRFDNPVCFQYQVEVSKFKKVVFEIDFDGSDNFQLEDGALKQETVVNPFERKTVAMLTLRNPRGPWALRCRYKWLEGDPDRDVVEAIVDRDMDTIGRMVEAAHDLDFGADSATVQQLQAKCGEFDVNFVDVEFPPSRTSLSSVAAEKARKEAAASGAAESKESEQLVTWRRPLDFFEGEYDIFMHSIHPSDIRQGGLGDCWLMCALSSLAERPEEVLQLFVSDVDPSKIQQANSAGVYKVRLCKNGEWQFVRLDDYFPCFPEAGPVYSKAHGNELWVLLVEKAMAKVCGGYDTLKGGWAYEALMDLTGAPSCSYRLEDDDIRAEIDSADDIFWKRLLEWDAHGYLMSCSTPGEDKWSEGGGHPQGGPGLVSGHAYSLIGVKQTSKGHKLLHIRNPWGSFEWNGNWSDHSPMWTDELKAELGVTLSHDDGAFWMDFEDFLTYFRGINVCKLRAGHTRWKEARKKGNFTYNRGKVTGTMYILSVPEKTEANIGVHQEDERVASSKPYLDMGVTILKEVDSGGYELVEASGVEVSRQVQLETVLEPGEYYVVPHTTGCKFAQYGGKAPDTPVRIYKDSAFTAEAETALREIFRRLDEDMDGVLDRDELNSFQQMSEGCDMMDEVYKWLIQTFDSRSGGLTADGFVECYYYMFEAADQDEEVVWRDLRYMGYDNALNLAGARTFVLSVHSDCEVGLWKVPFDPELFEEAAEIPVKAKGSATDFSGGDLRLYKLKSGYWGVTLACENTSPDKDVTFTLDCTSSTNVVSHTGALVSEQLIRAGETEIMHHLMPAEQGAWAWGYRASWRWAS